MAVFEVRINTLITKFEERMPNIHSDGQRLFVEVYLNYFPNGRTRFQIFHSHVTIRHTDKLRSLGIS